MNNCPACGAPLTLRPDTEGFECGYCHTAFFPGELDDGVAVSSEQPDPNLSCPICSQALVKAAIAQIPILFCNQCHGLLSRMPVLPDLIDERRSSAGRAEVQTPADHGDLKRVIQCPKCNRRMDTHFYAGPGNVVVDSCDNCELIWLDRGELTRIAHAPDEESTNQF